MSQMGSNCWNIKIRFLYYCTKHRPRKDHMMDTILLLHLFAIQLKYGHIEYMKIGANTTRGKTETNFAQCDRKALPYSSPAKMD